MYESPPSGQGRDLGAVCVDLVPWELAATSVDVDLGGAQPTLALPEPAADPEDDDDGQG